MANVIIPQRFWTRRGTASALTAANEVLYSGEWCLETDTGRAKYGDGITAWNDLDYSVPGRADLTTLSDGDVLIWDGSSGVWVPGVQTIDVNNLIGFPGGTTNFLREDGTFAPPGAGGGARGYAMARLATSGGSVVALGDHGGNPTTIVAGTDRQYYQPFTVERNITIATLYADVSSAQATSVFRIGVYSNDDSGSSHVPGALLGETGDLSGAAIGNVGGSLTPSVSLVPGVVYWSCLASRGGNATFRAHPVANFTPAWFGRATTTTNNPYNHVLVVAAWATLPSPYPGGGALTSANIPAIYMTE